ncbi:MAG: glycoside hydrolase family 2 TIM barrel-domain containing protein [Bryobacteraceae bacterium]
MRLILLLLASSLASLAARSQISLNGTWQLGESIDPQPPRNFGHTVPVPGLAHSATPPLDGVDAFDSREFIQVSVRERRLPESAQVQHAGLPRQTRNHLWYRRNFDAPARAARLLLRIRKAQFGHSVYVNGKHVGDARACFSASYFDVTGAVRWGASNELLVRIGAHPAALPVWAPAGTDFEKYKWTPGIYDDVDLIVLPSDVHIEHVQVAPRISDSSVVVETTVRNRGGAVARVAVRHVLAGRPSASRTITVPAGESVAVRETVRLVQPHLWSPEDPFLYTVRTTAGADALDTRFGFREFRFDTTTKRAYLNGKPYFLRGSNITLHRFFEDPLAKQHPWDRAWVKRLLVDLPKQFHWNAFRFCIGPAPDFWFDLADEAGLLIQNEFFIWNGRQYFPPYREEELLAQYRDWMRDHWNHPSVAVWDASNETDSDLLRERVIPAVRKLDLSNRPWDNGYSVPSGPDDPVEDHPYLFSRLRGNAAFAMTDLEQMTGAKTTNAGHPSAHAVILNEYGWLWLTRDGVPTLLTEAVYEKLLGKDATPEQRFRHYAYWLAGLTEFWRAHRNFAAVLHFTWLTCSYPGVKTGDHWRDVEKLELEPYFADWVKEAFQPLGVYINFWAPKLRSGERRNYSVMMVNDDAVARKGKLTLSFRGGETASQDFEIPALGAHTWNLRLAAPKKPGDTELTATAEVVGLEPTRSRRWVRVE